MRHSNTSYPNTPAVYGFVHRRKRRIYIGSTAELRRRLVTHIRELDDGRHVSWELQNDYTAGGIEIMALEHVSAANVQYLRQIEQDYINEYRSEGWCMYNSQTAARDTDEHSEEHLAKVHAKHWPEPL